MARNQSQKKNKLIELFILLFVVVAMGLLVVQISLNTMDTIEQTHSDSELVVTVTVPAAVDTATHAEPTPTFDYKDVELNDSN